MLDRMFTHAMKREHVVVICADGRTADRVRSDVARHALNTGQVQSTRYITTISASRGLQRLHGALMALVIVEARVTDTQMQLARELARAGSARLTVWDPE